MEISDYLKILINRARSEASSCKREFITPEEILYEILSINSFSDVFKSFGWNVGRIKRDIKIYINRNIDINENAPEDFIPELSEAVNEVIDDATRHCLESDKKFIDAEDFVVSLYDNPRLYASYIMKKEGIEQRVDLLEAIGSIKKSLDDDFNFYEILNLDNENGKLKDMSSSGFHKEEFIKFSDMLEGLLTGDFSSLKLPFDDHDGAESAEEDDEENEEENDEPEESDEILNPGQQAFLAKYTVNLNEKARSGKISPIVGRDEEIERTIQILCRYTKNNPLHVGEAGVGKTSITEGLASLLVKNEVPDALKGFTVYSLDLAALLAGTKFRGDFEERIKKLTDILLKCKKCILYIDEIHQLVGAGSGTSGSMDAGNLLKPVLSGSEIRCIGATTYDEYNKIFSKDSALSRRFQKIDVIEPDRDKAIEMLNLKKQALEAYHKVRFTKDAVESAVDLSIQYINDRKLPDKAIDLLDESGVYAKLHKAKNIEMPVVSVNTVRKVASKIARVPVEDVNATEKDRLKNIENLISSRVFGQDNAVKALCLSVKKSRAGFRNPEKPEGIFLFVGPTGVGKTELTKVLADTLNEKLLRFDMSEYQEKHTVSRLIGSPPGYVGFEEGGLLTDAVRKNPHSVILFDEIEKAHPDIYNLLLQVMDYGTLTDNQGRKADFKNCIIIMTSNAGAREMEKGSVGFEVLDSEKNGEASLMEAVEQAFTPEFRNRLDAIIPFAHLDKKIVNDIASSEIKKIALRLEAKKVHLDATPAAVSYIAEQGYSREYGARNISRKAEELIASPLVDEVLFGKLCEGGNVTADLEDKKIVFKY